ncbi:MAG: outer membrane protein assembly factor BamA [Gemmataceae bacterium]|nr:outer membrane protein assembly factor BamA [Gemmataceae bacterium]
MDGICGMILPRTTLTKRRHLVGVLLLLSALGLATPPAFAQASEGRTIVGDVYIVGVRTIPVEKAMIYVHTRSNRVYSYATVQDDVSRLAASNLFKYIRVKTDATSDGRMNVIFEVQEYPNVVRSVEFKHLKHFGAKDLEKEVSPLMRIQRGMPLNKMLNQQACFEIQEFLKHKGYYFSTVTLESGYDDSHDRVIFNIAEGPKVHVRSVDFKGQSELAWSERLRTQIDTSRAVFGQFGGDFRPLLVDNDVIKLEEYYRTNGYQNVQVSRELQFTDDFKQVDITFHIHEGNRFRVAEWSVEGTKAFPAEQLTSIIRLKKGDYFDENVVNADVRSLADFGGWRGYPFEVRKVVTEVTDQPDSVRVQYLVQDQPQNYVGEVHIWGNTVTKDRVIRRMLGFYPGQVLRYPELRNAERDLARLSIFEMNPELGIRPTVQALENPGPYKDIAVRVQETRTGSLMLGAGFNSNNGIVGSIVLNERNFDLFRFPTSFNDFFEGRAFRGAGQELRIEAMPGTEVQRYTISVREPFLFDQPYSLQTSAYYRDRVYNEYLEGRVGLRMGLSHQFTKEISGSVSFRGENVSVSNIAAGAPKDYTDVYGHAQIYAPSIAFTWDTRDSFMRPSEGGKLELSAEYVLGTMNYPILSAEASRYFTMWKRPDGSGKHVLMLHSQASWAGENTPVYERFFGGGYTSIRGFQFRGVGPTTNGFQTGGQFQLMNSIEYQIPVRANDNLYFVAFVDSGTVESKLSIKDYRVSAGVGLRISVPMLGPVPIALDFGFPIVKGRDDQTQLVAFWLGMYR